MGQKIRDKYKQLYIFYIHPGRRRPFLKWPSTPRPFSETARPFVGQRPIKEHLAANSEMALRYGIALRFRVLQWVGVAL